MDTTQGDYVQVSKSEIGAAVATDLVANSVSTSTLNSGVSFLADATITTLGVGTTATCLDLIATNSIIANDIASTSVATSTLNAGTSLLDDATINTFALTGNFTWPSFNALSQVALVFNDTSLVAKSILSGACTFVGGGSITTPTADNQTYTFSVASAGIYEIDINFMFAMSANNTQMTVTISGAVTHTTTMDRVSFQNTGFCVYRLCRFVTLAAGAQSLLVLYRPSAGRVNVKEVYISCRRVST